MKWFSHVSWIFLGILIGVTAGVIGAVSYSVKDFLTNVQVRTDQLPKAWVRWDTVMTGVRGCNWIDLSRVNEAPRVGWTPAWDYIQLYLIPIFGNPPLSEAEKEYCYGDWTQYEWRVSPNGTKLDRPMYEAVAWFESGTWKESGRIAVGTVCEDAEIRKTTYSYRFATNNAIKRGLVACQLVAK